MQAIRVHEFGGPEVLKYETDAPAPKLEPGSVLVRVKAVGVNPVDVYIRAGAFGPKEFPFTPGHDCAGVVEDVGAEVTSHKKGDRVFLGNAKSGSYAELVVASASDVQPLPVEVSFEQGASLPVPYYTAYRALVILAKGKPGDTVLVHGASGGVGVAAVQMARAYGMRVLGTASTQKGLDLVKEAGADLVFNHGKDGYLDAIKAATEANGGINVILENAAHFNLGKDLTLLAKGGCVAVIGCRSPLEINPSDLMMREARVVGVLLFLMTEVEARETMGAIQGGMKAGWLRPVVGKVYPLQEAAAAHKEIMEGKAKGKMVLTVS